MAEQALAKEKDQVSDFDAMRCMRCTRWMCYCAVCVFFGYGFGVVFVGYANSRFNEAWYLFFLFLQFEVS